MKEANSNLIIEQTDTSFVGDFKDYRRFRP